MTSLPSLLLKAVLGALVVILIQLLAGSKSFYIAGLVPLFPTFTLISNYIIGTQRSIAEFKQTLRFGMASMIPYFVYMLVLYVLVDRLKLVPALLCATMAWMACAVLLILVWNR